MDVLINQILGLNKLQYHNYVDGQYNLWCENLSHVFYVPMRELQKNSQLYSWFLVKWDERIVKPFLRNNKDFIIAKVQDPETYMQLFQDIVESPYSMKGVYPSAIVKTIKKEHHKNLKNDE